MDNFTNDLFINHHSPVLAKVFGTNGLLSNDSAISCLSLQKFSRLWDHLHICLNQIKVSPVSPPHPPHPHLHCIGRASYLNPQTQSEIHRCYQKLLEQWKLAWFEIVSDMGVGSWDGLQGGILKLLLQSISRLFFTTLLYCLTNWIQPNIQLPLLLETIYSTKGLFSILLRWLRAAVVSKSVGPKSCDWRGVLTKQVCLGGPS